ncbi:MAG: DUF460 domain-containing protein [Candidatus Aenigmatarchaeota archaeon]
MEPEKIILGYDPGTTIGLAFVSLKGKVLGVVSKKHAGMDETINLIMEKGTPVLIATDKEKLPSTLEQLASNFKATVFSPEEDLSIEKKNELAEGHETENLHERDALAAALYAYYDHQNKLRKIDKRMDDLNLPNLAPRIKELVLRGEVKNISDAVDRALEPEKGEDEEGEEERMMPEEDLEERIDKFRQSLLKERKDKEKLKEHNERLKNEVNNLKRAKGELKKELKEVKEGKKDSLMENEKIADLQRKLRSKKNEVRSLKIELEEKRDVLEEFKQLERIRKQGNYPVREIEELTYEALEEAKKKLNLENSVLSFRKIEKEAEGIRERLKKEGVKAVLGNFSKEFRDRLVEEGIAVLDPEKVPIKSKDGRRYIEGEVIDEAIQADRKSFLEWLKRYRKRGS